MFQNQNFKNIEWHDVIICHYFFLTDSGYVEFCLIFKSGRYITLILERREYRSMYV